jgi:hypothetical protein
LGKLHWYFRAAHSYLAIVTRRLSGDHSHIKKPALTLRKKKETAQLTLRRSIVNELNG